MSSVTLLPCVDCRFPTLFEASRSAVPLLHLPICLGPRTRTNLRGRRRHYRGHRPLVRGLPRHAQNPLAPGLLRPNPRQSISLYRPDSPNPLLS